MPSPDPRAQRPTDSPRSRRRLQGLVALSTLAVSIVLAVEAIGFATVKPQTTDFAGVAATHQAQAASLGCIYSRPVQLAGARLVPGLVGPGAATNLTAHFNEPPVMTLLAAPLATLSIGAAVDVWEVVLLVAVAVCAFLLWREMAAALPRLVIAGVVAALLLNQIANTDFSLAQNDALLLVAALLTLELMRRHLDIAAGLLLGVVAIKPQLAFLAVFALLIHHRWRVVAACVATVAAIGAVSIAMVGPACSVQWLGSATRLDEFQIGIGLPGTLARWTGSTMATEVAFVLLALAAVWVLFRIRTRVDTPMLVTIAIALAVVIGLHTLAYDVLFLAPLGIAVARSEPWAVVTAGWVFTLAQILYPRGTAPLLATELVPLVAVAIAVIFVVRHGDPAAEDPGPVATPDHRQLVAAT